MNAVIAVVGLGYVGLPLAVHFGTKTKTIGFDINKKIITNSKNNIDPTGEVSSEEFKLATQLEVTSNPESLHEADFIVIAVPTPIDEAHQPDLFMICEASKTVGKHMKKNSIVIYESTVYPGVTEDVCVPILEKYSDLKWKDDFHVGYSPERINPGDKEHTLTKIVKVVSGDTEETLEKVAELYESIIVAGVHRTKSIKEAEAAKVIENTQRDLNIALMNELAIIFDKMNIDTANVLEAAGTKWNFLKFSPGLVGGHCIGVDPYYLTYKAQLLGYQPEVILSGRRINDGMGKYVVEQLIKLMIHKGKTVKNSNVGILGLTFKEDCPDLRNTRVTDIIKELKTYGIEPRTHDALADPEEAEKHLGVILSDWRDLNNLDALIIAVPHRQYYEKGNKEILKLVNPDACIIDVKSMMKQEDIRDDLSYWRL